MATNPFLYAPPLSSRSQPRATDGHCQFRRIPSPECDTRHTIGITGGRNPKAWLLVVRRRHLPLRWDMWLSRGPRFPERFPGDRTVGSPGSHHQAAGLELLFTSIPRFPTNVHVFRWPLTVHSESFNIDLSQSGMNWKVMSLKLYSWWKILSNSI